jgi:hypothetical protein
MSCLGPKFLAFACNSVYEHFPTNPCGGRIFIRKLTIFGRSFGTRAGTAKSAQHREFPEIRSNCINLFNSLWRTGDPRRAELYRVTENALTGLPFEEARLSAVSQ